VSPQKEAWMEQGKKCQIGVSSKFKIMPKFDYFLFAPSKLFSVLKKTWMEQEKSQVGVWFQIWS
jgi:hypothetical protein